MIFDNLKITLSEDPLCKNTCFLILLWNVTFFFSRNFYNKGESHLPRAKQKTLNKRTFSVELRIISQLDNMFTQQCGMFMTVHIVLLVIGYSASLNIIFLSFTQGLLINSVRTLGNEDANMSLMGVMLQLCAWETIMNNNCNPQNFNFHENKK